jgi:hypothetical protein
MTINSKNEKQPQLNRLYQYVQTTNTYLLIEYQKYSIKHQ